ncbi:flavoprotein [Nocardia asteroides]|uniref:flavoprotein n=1 Tax=Nocardia asteroides TaxID=1824 RepID=UPI0037C7792A
MDERTKVLYAMVTGAGGAEDIGKLVALAQADGWTVCVLASPNGTRFIDVEALAAQTGYPVRSTFKEPGTVDLLPKPDAVIVAPLTTNTMAKWAAGIGDTLPLSLLVETVGAGLPVVAVPHARETQFKFPAVAAALSALTEWGVRFIRIGEGDSVPWAAALKALD